MIGPATTAAMAPAFAPARPRLDLAVTVDPGARRLTGVVRLALPNVSAHPLSEIQLWLYPNRLRERPAALGDVSFHWLYPNGFSAAAMHVLAARVGGAAVAVTLSPSVAGRDTIARVALPAPVPPGAVAEIEVTFTSELPQRLGGFGCVGTQCRLMGGFYPFPLHLGPDGFVVAAPPDRVDYTAQVTVPGGTDVLLGDGYARAAGAPVAATGRDVPYPTLLTDRGLGADDVTAAGFRARLYHRGGARPPPSGDGVLPYVREDRVGLILEGARRALEFIAAEGLRPADADADRPLTLIEVPLRHELVKVHGDVVLVSDHLFEIFPLERLRKFHRLELVRAVMTAVLDRALRRIEPDADVDLSAEVMAAYLTEIFTLDRFRRLEFARDLLRPLAFLPAVDQMIYAPLLASSASYFGDLDDRDVVRDDVRRFAEHRPGGRLVYAKLLDLLGSAGMNRLARLVLGDKVPLRVAAARVFGAPLDWFWRQWWGAALPRVNYHLGRVRTAPLVPAGVHVTVDVERQGADLREPVELRVTDRAGVPHDLIWAERGAAHRFELDLPAGLASVELDPRHRLVESALGSLGPSDDPLTDNRQPKRWRLIYSGFGALLDLTNLQASFAAAVTLKPEHDLRNEFELLALHSLSTEAGLNASYARLFGPQADTNRLTSAAGLGLTVARPNPTFGVAAGAPEQPGWRLSGNLFFTHDDRDYFIDPWRAVGLSAGLGYTLTALESGARLSQWFGAVEALRLFELLPGHVLALDVSAGATFGDIQKRSQLEGIGGPLGLRGYGVDELQGRGQAVARLELRDRYVSDLDWNIAHFTSVRGFGGNLFAEAGMVSSCDALDVSKGDLFYDVGYTFRVLHDAFGVYQQMLAIDLAIPLNRHDRVCLGQHSNDPQMTLRRPPFVVLISFLPAF